VLQTLERVTTDGRSGLRMLLEGPPLDDNKGERELNEFASVCWQIRMDATRPFMAIQSAINTEENKQTNAALRADGPEAPDRDGPATGVAIRFQFTRAF